MLRIGVFLVSSAHYTHLKAQGRPVPA